MSLSFSGSFILSFLLWVSPEAIKFLASWALIFTMIVPVFFLDEEPFVSLFNLIYTLGVIWDC